MKKHLPSLKRALLVIVILGDLIAFISLVVPFISPIPVVLNATHGEAALFFSADRHVVFLPGMCINLDWKAEPIRSIYLNKEGKAGESSQSYCPGYDKLPLTFSVTFQDGTSQDYKLDVVSELQSPQFVVLSFAVVLLSFLALMLAKTTFMLRFLTGRAQLFRLDIRIVLFIWMIVVMILYQFPFYYEGSILNQVYTLFLQFFSAPYHG